MPELEFSPEDRAEIAWRFPTGGRWSDLRRDAEGMRWFQVVVETPERVLLRHGNNALVDLDLRADRIGAVRLLEGEAAEQALRAHAFRPNDTQRARAEALFAIGQELSTIDADPHARLYERLHGSPVRYDIERSGVLELTLVEGRITARAWRVGGDALDALRAGHEAWRWAVPTFPGVAAARTEAEARLFVAVMAGDPEAERSSDGRFEILARIPEGPRRFVFTVDRPGASPSDLGSGVSRCLDAAELLLFAARVERELPASGASRRAVHARQLTLAASALLEATRFVPDGATEVPVEALRTAVGRHLRVTQPGRFTLDHLLGEATRLDTLARAWGA